MSPWVFAVSWLGVGACLEKKAFRIQANRERSSCQWILGIKIGDQVGEQIGDQVGDQVGDRVGDPLGDQLGDQLGESDDGPVVDEFSDEALHDSLPSTISV